MNGAVAWEAPHPTVELDWLGRVRGELRPEFAGEVIRATAGGPALTGAPCPVPGCRRAAVANGLCGAHHKPWNESGRPPVEQWAPSAPPRRKGVGPLRPCDAPGCRRGRAEAGLCQTHVLRWKRAGCPDLAGWVATSSGSPLRPFPPCPAPDCGLEAEGRVGLCRSHTSRWISHGRPSLEEFLAECDSFGHDRFDLRSFPPVMRAEIAYGLQRRADEARTQTRPDQLRRLFARLPAGVESLRERSAAEWLEVLGWCDRKSVARRFLTDTLGWLDDLSDGVGWHSEFDRYVWQLRRLGYPHRDARLRFEPIEAVWLRQLTKRWARWRLSTGISPSTVSTGVVAVSRLAEAFPQLRRGPEAFSRELLERHLAHLAERYPNPKGRAAHISAIASLLRAVRQHDWEPRLPATTEVYREDYPRLDEPAPRAISEAVMAQLESPANLERFTDAQARVLAEILMRTGLRVGDGCRLAIDCVVRDQHGAPYLRYRNHKMRRDALVPLDDRLAETIAEQRQATQARFPAAGHLLVREKRNPDGRLNYSADTFRNRLTAWLTDCNVRDELGRPVHVTPHQWRHTYATRFQRRCPPRGRAPPAGPHDPSHDGPLRPAVAAHHPNQVGSGPEGRCARPTGRPAGGAAGRRRMDEEQPGPGEDGPPQRLLRAAAPAALRVRQRLPHLPDVRHHRRVPARASPPAHHHPKAHRQRRGRWSAAPRRNEPHCRGQPAGHHRCPRRGRR